MSIGQNFSELFNTFLKTKTRKFSIPQAAPMGENKHSDRHEVKTL